MWRAPLLWHCHGIPLVPLAPAVLDIETLQTHLMVSLYPDCPEHIIWTSVWADPAYNLSSPFLRLCQLFRIVNTLKLVMDSLTPTIRVVRQMLYERDELPFISVEPDVRDVVRIPNGLRVPGLSGRIELCCI